MTYAEASHVSLAIRECVVRCRQSSEPYRELSNFISALREGGVSEHYIQAINRAALREIAATMIATPPSGQATVGAAGKIPVPNYCYILQ